MQQALAQMNLPLANVISDVVGETGQKILRAIRLHGERDGYMLPALKSTRIRASSDEIAKSLRGNWRAEHLFALKQALALFDFDAGQRTECDREIEAQLHCLEAHEGSPAKGERQDQAARAHWAAQALRLAAAALRTRQSALGAYFRRMCSRMDKPKAVTAAAHKLARLIYSMLTRGEEDTDQGQDYFEERYRQRVLRQLTQRAEKLGMKLVASAQPA